MCECFKIGGPFIAEDPDCEAHGTDARARVSEADKLRAELARVTAELVETQAVLMSTEGALARVTAQRDQARKQADRNFEALKATQDAHSDTMRQRDQAIKDRDAWEETFRLERLMVDRLSERFDLIENQRDQALRLIRCTQVRSVNPELHAWARRASDPTKPWPDVTETEEILRGGK